MLFSLTVTVIYIFCCYSTVCCVLKLFFEVSYFYFDCFCVYKESIRMSYR
uniref:Uncharacterized protein n=1 Tax=Anguilla anguilla TaxID=7936 RepID=A0A0E9WN64_ANGAN